MRSAFILLLVCLFLPSCGERQTPVSNRVARAKLDQSAADLNKKKEFLTRFFKPMQTRPGDWLESHPEDGETFEDYIGSDPTLPTGKRKTIYIQPVGSFTKKQLKVISLTADYMKAFFNLPVVMQDAKPLGIVSDDLVRVQYPNNKQIRTSYFIDNLLPPMLPDDGAALICLTSNDLYPGDTWNFVFGQASLEKRVGVWSLWRLEQDGSKAASEDLLLARTLKIAMHETAHMFSMRHCTKYECLMSGTNSLEETDRRPMDVCPECVAKFSWALKYDLSERYKNLAVFWKKQNRLTESRQMLEKAGALCGCKVEV
jgi:archaemetzincin